TATATAVSAAASAQSLVSNSEGQSSKLVWLLNSLRTLHSSDPTAKAVVFSQWTGMLDRIGAMLDANGYANAYRRLDGQMSTTQQKDSLQSFRSDRSKTLFLISLKAGGVGLNLTSANTLYLYDI